MVKGNEGRSIEQLNRTVQYFYPHFVDAAPIGINICSTVATYANVHNKLRRPFARTPDTKTHRYRAGDFSYNTGSLRYSTCDGTGVISLDVQFLPDVDIPCPDCGESRYNWEVGRIMLHSKQGEAFSLPQLMAIDVNTALTVCMDQKLVRQRLQVLRDLGLGYLTLGEETSSISGGEAQRLKAGQRDEQGSGRCRIYC